MYLREKLVAVWYQGQRGWGQACWQTGVLCLMLTDLVFRRRVSGGS